jgi:precorrin-2 dehydrogenase/sirohydrochlorin ferrochelatase
MLDGTAMTVLVVGGGAVAGRKTRALLDAGATVRLVAPRIDPALRSLDVTRLSLEVRNYSTEDIGDAMLVIAATSSREVNARVALDARNRGRLVNVVDAPDDGNCTVPATHRAGDLVIAVSAGGVPSVATRIRDSIAARYDDAYAAAVAQLGAMRASLLASGERARWTELVDNVIGDDFCEVVERGELDDRVAAWR